MHQTIVINMKITHHWDIRIDRASKWGNPFHLQDNTPSERRRCLAEYEHYIRTNEKLLAALPELIGKRLACWCVPRPCHGHILLKIMKERGLIDANGFCV
jgi:hypothetical protein